MRIHVILAVSLCLLVAACKNDIVYNDEPAKQCSRIADTMYLNGRKEEATRFLDSASRAMGENVLCKYMSFAVKTQYYVEKKSYTKAMLANDSSLAVIEKTGTQQRYFKEYAHSLLLRGTIFTNAEQYDSAYKAYINGYKFVLSKQDYAVMHEFDYYIGMLFYRQNNYVKAKDFFLKSFDEAGKCDESNRPWYRMQELLDNIALCCPPDRGGFVYFDSCISFINHNLARFQTRDMVADALSNCYKNKGMRLLNRYRVREAKVCFIKSIEVYERLDSVKYHDMIVDRLLNLGVSLYYADDTQGVVKLWTQLKPIGDTLRSEHSKELWLQLNFMYYDLKKDYMNAYFSYIAYNNYLELQRNSFVDNSRKDISKDLKNLEQDYNIQLLKKEKQLQRVSLWVAIALSCLAVVIIVLVYRNYKRTRRANEIIGRQKAALEASNREKDIVLQEKDAILNVVAHDLRNPIGSISFIADMMLMEDGSALAPGEAFGMIKNASTGSLKLVDELLEVARNDKKSLKKEIADIGELVRQSVLGLKFKADEKGQELTCRVQDGLGPMSVDKQKIARVVSNLVTNAIKFSPQGGRVAVDVENEKGGVVIKVADNGIGIPADMIPGLFQMFTNARRRGTANEESFGLGLAICKQIVEAHDGTLHVTSQEGRGSTFTIYLPA
jgi:two-component system sensor histidine kinase VicK